ncbi:anoctamin-10, partial [Phenoliferia sp. Uapishka_3]
MAAAIRSPLPESTEMTQIKSSLKTSSQGPTPAVDLIIKFTLNNLSTTTPADSKSQTAVSVEKEYDSLLGVLKDAGLEATGRPGAQGSNEVLIFVRATELRIQSEIHRERYNMPFNVICARPKLTKKTDRMSDWLNGVASTRPSPRTPRDFSNEPIHPSERLRLVHSILTSPRTGSNVSITSSASAGSTAGLSPLPSPKAFPHVVGIFPPHDLAFNKNWLDKWSSKNHIMSIPPEELTLLKDHLGETVALYFAFLRYYFFALAFPTVVGALFYLLGWPYSGLYGTFIVTWSTLFVESWRIKERQYAVEWGTYGVHKVEVLRSEFQGDQMVVDKVTGVEKDFFPWWKTLGRQLATIPVLVVFAGVLATLISGIYAIEVVVGEVYSGPGKRFMTLVPTVLFAGLVPQFTALWNSTANKLTVWENHPHQTEHENSRTLKVFALNFFVAFGSLLLTSYIYIPFGGFLVPYILSHIPHHREKFSVGKSYAIDASKLHTQIVAYTLTNQITGAFLEIGLPFLTSLLFKKVAEVRQNHSEEKNRDVPVDDEDEKAFLERVRTESALPRYAVFADYSEMAMQFGYLTLFSVIWPVAPVWSFVNNFFELRSDAFKLTNQSQRPIPTREASIGPWLEVLGFITWIGTLTNASLVYLYRPHITHSSKTTSLLSSLTGVNLTLTHNNNNGTLIALSNMHVAQNSPSPISTIQATLFSALLVALATEHAYLIFRVCIRFILERVSWRDSEADVKVRGAVHEVRKVYLDEMGLREGPVRMAERSGKAEEARRVDEGEEREKE